jgi:hypothetical protein
MKSLTLHVFSDASFPKNQVFTLDESYSSPMVVEIVAC